MPVRIRLSRRGKKGRPFYYIVVADSRAPRDGKFIEKIGTYNPMTNPAAVDLEFEKALYWLQAGAQPSDSVRSLLSHQGVMHKNHLLNGVRKGAITEAEAEAKFEKWIKEKTSKLQSVVEKVETEKQAQKKKALNAESKVREARAHELAIKNSQLAKVLGVTVEPAKEIVADAKVEENN